MGYFVTYKPKKQENSIDFYSLNDFEMKVLLATEKPFAKVASDGIREIVEKAGYELVVLEKYTDKSELLKAVADVDAIIIRSDKITAEVIEAAKNLKIVVRAGAGYDNVDLAAATARKIVVMNTPGQNSNAVAELAIGLMIFMARNKFASVSTPTAMWVNSLPATARASVWRYMPMIPSSPTRQCMRRTASFR